MKSLLPHLKNKKYSLTILAVGFFAIAGYYGIDYGYSKYQKVQELEKAYQTIQSKFNLTIKKNMAATDKLKEILADKKINLNDKALQAGAVLEQHAIHYEKTTKEILRLMQKHPILKQRSLHEDRFRTQIKSFMQSIFSFTQLLESVPDKLKIHPTYRKEWNRFSRAISRF